ncbi:hypothetical protein EW146_g8939 [Bondarzewia mesenterica]|uniref:DNA repair protein rhp7 treble clef domain-containing protein n=1 Tax=Bondarzewia mesenterica TaxID=1095465 RepID=A0A4S4LAQ8_9AGAM|nr:hypothetical protein EW146_g8939 [Bondarzewia mesenterica]
MSRNNVRGPTSALTEFLKESGITAASIARRVRTRHNPADPSAAGPSNTSQAQGEVEESNVMNGAGPSRRTRSGGRTVDYNSDDLDEVNDGQPTKKRKLSKAAEAKLKTKAKKAAKKGDDDDYEDEDEDAYTALSKSMWTNAGSSGPKPPIGSFEECAKCEKQFTVTKYTLVANPPPGFLCHSCAKASGADPFKKPAATRKRKTATDKRVVINFEEKRFPTLVFLCIQVISKYINEVEALGEIGSINMDSIIRALSRNRSLTPESVNLFYNAENTNLTLYDATKLIPDALSSLAYLNPNLTNLRLDFCGRMNDSVVESWSTVFPNLERIELLGPFLVRVPGWMQFFKSHPQLKGFLITQSPRFDLECIRMLSENCKNLTELRLKEVGKLNDGFLEHIEKLIHITHLDLSDPSDSLSEHAVTRLLSILGPKLAQLDLSGHGLLGDEFLKDAFKPHLRNLRSLALNNLPLVTDAAFASLFEAWSNSQFNLKIATLSFARVPELGSKSLVTILSHPCSSCLTHLNINGWRHTSEDALKAIGEHARELRKLDIGWNREVDDFIVKAVLDGCSRLEEIKLWGCNKVTANCPRKRNAGTIAAAEQSASDKTGGQEDPILPSLDQSVGYGVVVARIVTGVGFFFAGVMLLMTFLQSKFSGISPSASEEFSCERMDMECNTFTIQYSSIHTGLSSDGWTMRFLGVSGPWWYGVGGTIQVAIFAMVAAKVKLNANGAHTFLEIVRIRFGTGAHLLFTFYAFLCILIVSGSLLLGGAATVTALTGMNTNAACMLLPVGIAIYVIFGGLRATFICDWSHTVILFTIIYIFIFRVYATSPEIGSISRMYALLKQAGIDTPVAGNKDGSYLTMKSNGGLVFGAATILSGFSGVFCTIDVHPDVQGTGNGAPESTTKAYMLGGLSWFAIPWAFASCLGLAARALVTNPNFPTYPHALSASQTSAGLAAPAAAAVVMGKGGAVAVLLVVFMAVTSAASAELIAVSSLFSYDLYRTYYRPQASGREIVRVSHAFICFWAIWMGCWAVILHRASIDLGWLFYVQGVVLSPAVIPIGLTVTWRKLSRMAVITGSLSGAALSMIAWIVGCKKIYGKVNVTNLAEPYSAVCSGLTGLLFSGIVTVSMSLIKPANYDFNGTRNITSPDDPIVDDPERASTNDEKDKSKNGESYVKEALPETDNSQELEARKTIKKTFRKAAIYSALLTICVTIVGLDSVPLPMFFSSYIFSEKFYAFWVVCTILWAFLSGTFCIILPLWESRKEMAIIGSSAYNYFLYGTKPETHIEGSLHHS